MTLSVPQVAGLKCPCLSVGLWLNILFYFCCLLMGKRLFTQGRCSSIYIIGLDVTMYSFFVAIGLKEIADD